MSTRSTYKRLAALCAILSWLTKFWWVIVLAFSIASPISPHLRLTSPQRTSCAYFGVHGILYEPHEGRCPLIDFIDTQGRGQW